MRDPRNYERALYGCCAALVGFMLTLATCTGDGPPELSPDPYGTRALRTAPVGSGAR